MIEQFPRLLVATEFPPNASGGGPAVVRQMLKEWPTDRLFWWSCLPDQDKRFGQKLAEQATATIPSRLYPNRRLRAIKSSLMASVWSPWAAWQFRKTLRNLKPEVVWAIPHGWSIPPLVRSLPDANIGFHVSIHDYADTRSNVMRLGATRSRKQADMADQLYASATSRDAISQPMADDLRVRTGRDGSICRAGLEQRDLDYLSGKPNAPSAPIRIAYAGTILVEDVFEKFVIALDRVRKRLPTAVVLEFFGAHTHRTHRWFDPAWMLERGNLAEPQLTLALRECSWGFSPMSLGDDDPRYNRFSFPTKFISYLAAGLPVITLGHRESSVMKMAEAYGVGLCTATGELEKLGGELLAALEQPEASVGYRPAIVRCAKAEFDARRMRAVLHECFHNCARR